MVSLRVDFMSQLKKIKITPQYIIFFYKQLTSE